MFSQFLHIRKVFLTTFTNILLMAPPSAILFQSAAFHSTFLGFITFSQLSVLLPNTFFGKASRPNFVRISAALRPANVTRTFLPRWFNYLHDIGRRQKLTELSIRMRVQFAYWHKTLLLFSVFWYLLLCMWQNSICNDDLKLEILKLCLLDHALLW